MPFSIPGKEKIIQALAASTEASRGEFCWTIDIDNAEKVRLWAGGSQLHTCLLDDLCALLTARMATLYMNKFSNRAFDRHAPEMQQLITSEAAKFFHLLPVGGKNNRAISDGLDTLLICLGEVDEALKVERMAETVRPGIPALAPSPAVVIDVEEITPTGRASRRCYILL